MDYIPGRNGGRLRRIPKGQSGNPKGKAKMPDLKEAMARSLGETNKDGTTALDQIIQALRRKAAQGDVRAAELLLARGFGKVPEKVDVTTAGEKIVTPPIVWLKPDPEEP